MSHIPTSQCWKECKTVEQLWKIVWQFLKKLRIYLSCNHFTPKYLLKRKHMSIQRLIHESSCMTMPNHTLLDIKYVGLEHLIQREDHSS